MVGLLIGMFAFFWLHSALWFYREYKDRKAGKTQPHVRADALPAELAGQARPALQPDLAPRPPAVRASA